MITTTKVPDPVELFRGERQREWVEQMQTPEGLDPAGDVTGRWSGAAYGRVCDVARRLRWAGFVPDLQPLGPRGGQRWVLDTADYDPARGEVAALLETSGGSIARSLAPASEVEDVTRALHDDAELRAKARRLLDAISRPHQNQFGGFDAARLARRLSDAEAEIAGALATDWDWTTPTALADLEDVTRAVAAWWR